MRNCLSYFFEAVSMEERQQGMMDGLEMAIEVCERSDSFSNAKDLLRYYLDLMKEDKFEKIKVSLGALR